MFKKMMAKLGIGSAKVNLVLDHKEYELGEKVEGRFIIEGGSVPQSVNKIDVDFLLAIRTKKQEYTRVIDRIHISGPFTIGASEKKEIPFFYELPKGLLLSSHTISYFFITNLDIAGGVDSLDRDYIDITPPWRLKNMMAAFEELGFREKHDSRSFNGYTQEFEFSPTSFLREEVEEIEFIVAIEEEQIRMLLEVDLYAFGRGEVEIKQEIVLSNELLTDVSILADFFRSVLAEMVETPHAYLHHPTSFRHGHHRHSGFGGALGSLAMGLLGGVVISEIMDGLMDNTMGNVGEELESALGGEDGEDGGFFDDMFGGGDE